MNWSPSRSYTWLIAAGAILLVYAIGHFVGYTIEHNSRVLADRAVEQRYTSLSSELQTARARLASAQSVNALLEAHVAIYRAAAALDNRNFGLANSAVEDAVTWLDQIDATDAGLDVEELRAVSAQAAVIKISVATDLAAQRGHLLRLADAIDALATKSQTIAGVSASNK